MSEDREDKAEVGPFPNADDLFSLLLFSYADNCLGPL